MRRGDVTRRMAAHTAARTCVNGTTGSRTTRRTHDEASDAWSARRFARGSALARRRRLPALGEPSRR